MLERSGCAKRPVIALPRILAMAWVCRMPRVSSILCSNLDFFVQVHHCVPWNTTRDYPHHNDTRRAVGVIQTSPVIIPLMAPMSDGLPKMATSQQVQIKRLVAAQIWVFSTAIDESTFAENGSPPLKPVHPIHKIPAPASVRGILFGWKSSLSFFILGPTYRQLQTIRISKS